MKARSERTSNSFVEHYLRYGMLRFALPIAAVVPLVRSVFGGNGIGFDIHVYVDRFLLYLLAAPLLALMFTVVDRLVVSSEFS